MRAVLEIVTAVVVGLGLEAAMTDNRQVLPPRELAAAELGLDGYPAPLDPYRAFAVASLAGAHTAQNAPTL